ncbi:MAG: rod shape-determining protein MreC [Paramuribaculum sp.]|nr:rod shape-determining protein MreC [Paramuribaculum sp.]
MHNLLSFLIKARPWILFTIYVVASSFLLFRNNPYQHWLYLTSANAISAGTYRAANYVTSYFNLRSINEDLQSRNTELELEILRLKDKVKGYMDKEYAETVPVDTAFSRYDFILAHVINNSVIHAHNYITIDKGELDGVRPDMGVIDQNGIVGKVNIVGPHSARIISLLNNNLRISCKVRGSEQVGSLVWDGKDTSTALLEELPRHAKFAIGDTIVTSGYSTAFPEGVPVGVVIAEKKYYDENFYTLSIKLFTDFTTLSTVRVVVDDMASELAAIENDTPTE